LPFKVFHRQTIVDQRSFRYIFHRTDVQIISPSKETIMKYFMLSLVLLISGCASRHLANKAVDISSDTVTDDIRFTYEVKDEFSTEYFGMLGFVIENNTNQWMTVDSVEIEGSDLDKDNIALIGGNDINVWFSSMNKAKQIESVNRQRLWGTISFIATLGTITAKDNDVKAVSALTAVGSSTLLTLERFNNFRRYIDLASYFPEDHLLRTPFRIPPGLGVDKWMVVNSQVNDKNKIASGMTVKVYMNGGKGKEYAVEFIRNITKSNYAGTVYGGNWQRQTVKKTFAPKKK
jgi:hypothetical protein